METRMIISHISRVRHVQNLYQSCSSHDRHIDSVETFKRMLSAREESELLLSVIFVALVR